MEMADGRGNVQEELLGLNPFATAAPSKLVITALKCRPCGDRASFLALSHRGATSQEWSRALEVWLMPPRKWPCHFT